MIEGSQVERNNSLEKEQEARQILQQERDIGRQGRNKIEELERELARVKEDKEKVEGELDTHKLIVTEAINHGKDNRRKLEEERDELTARLIREAELKQAIEGKSSKILAEAEDIRRMMREEGSREIQKGVKEVAGEQGKEGKAAQARESLDQDKDARKLQARGIEALGEIARQGNRQQQMDVEEEDDVFGVAWAGVQVARVEGRRTSSEIERQLAIYKTRGTPHKGAIGSSGTREKLFEMRKVQQRATMKAFGACGEWIDSWGTCGRISDCEKGHPKLCKEDCEVVGCKEGEHVLKESGWSRKLTGSRLDSTGAGGNKDVEDMDIGSSQGEEGKPKAEDIGNSKGKESKSKTEEKRQDKGKEPIASTNNKIGLLGPNKSNWARKCAEKGGWEFKEDSAHATYLDIKRAEKIKFQEEVRGHWKMDGNRGGRYGGQGGGSQMSFGHEAGFQGPRQGPYPNQGFGMGPQGPFQGPFQGQGFCQSPSQGAGYGPYQDGFQGPYQGPYSQGAYQEPNRGANFGPASGPSSGPGYGVIGGFGMGCQEGNFGGSGYGRGGGMDRGCQENPGSNYWHQGRGGQGGANQGQWNRGVSSGTRDRIQWCQDIL